MSHLPSIDVSGSYFPVWMLFLIVGILLTTACRAILLRFKFESEVGHPALIYPCLTVLFTCLLWLAWSR